MNRKELTETTAIYDYQMLKHILTNIILSLINIMNCKNSQPNMLLSEHYDLDVRLEQFKRMYLYASSPVTNRDGEAKALKMVDLLSNLPNEYILPPRISFATECVNAKYALLTNAVLSPNQFAVLINITYGGVVKGIRENRFPANKVNKGWQIPKELAYKYCINNNF